MSQSESLVDFLYGLIRDGGQRAVFSADPAAAFAQHGITDPSPQHIYEALVLIGDDQDLGRGSDVLHIPPPPPPAYFGDHNAHQAGARYLDNYVSTGFDDDQGPFTGNADAHGLDADLHGDPTQHADDAADHVYDSGHGYDDSGAGLAADGHFGTDSV